MDYKNKFSRSFPSFSRNIDMNTNFNQFCPSEISHYYRKQIESGVSPISEMAEYFGDEILIFDELFMQRVDSFCADHQPEGIELLHFLFFGNPNNIKYYSGVQSIPILLGNLPNTFEIFAFMLANQLSFVAKNVFCSINWIDCIAPFIEDQSHHLFISIIIKSIDFAMIQLSSSVNENIFSIFFDICSILLQSPNKYVVVNILDAFLNHLYTNYPSEVLNQLLLFTETPIFQSDILPFTNEFENIVRKTEEDEENFCLNEQIIESFLLLLANTIDDSNCKLIFGNQSIINLFTTVFMIDDEILSGAAEFANSIVSLDDAVSLLLTPEFLDRIFFLLNESKFAIRKSMILLISDLIVSQSVEHIAVILSKGLLESLFDYLEIEQDENTFEILQAIQQMFTKLEGTEYIDAVMDILIENQETIKEFVENDCLSIAEKAQSILQSMSLYQLA